MIKENSKILVLLVSVLAIIGVVLACVPSKEEVVLNPSDVSESIVETTENSIVDDLEKTDTALEEIDPEATVDETTESVEPTMTMSLDEEKVEEAPAEVPTETVEETASEEEVKKYQTLNEDVKKENTSKIEEKLETQTIKVNGLTFTYDPNLANVNMDNIIERFNKFAPNDSYEKTVEAMAKMALGEAGGCSHTEIAATMWCVLDRYDDGYSKSIFGVISAPGQFHGYSSGKAVRADIYELSKDVIARWVAEKEGNENVGRVLPPHYNWFHGDGRHNHFRNAYKNGTRWDWSLPTPYAD